VFFLFFKSLIIGLAISAPVGPIGLLCIHRSLRYGLKTGFMTGMGAATADAFYGIIAAFGLTALSGFFIKYQSWIHVLGGIFLIGLGCRLIFKRLSLRSRSHIDRSLWHAYGTTFVLTMINPVTVVCFMAIFAGLGLGSQSLHHYGHAITVVLGIFLGSASWWLLLSSMVALVLHHRIKEHSIHTINKISGSLLILFGIVALIW